MNPEAIGVYEDALTRRSHLSLVSCDGDEVVELDMARYLGDVDDADSSVVARAIAPVLDVGCGPGRIVAELARLGHAALGIDIALRAVEISARRGGTALVRDVFGRVPGVGRWPTIVVLDGNIGIGGDVDALLARTAELLAPDGQLLVEASVSDDSPPVDDVITARFASAPVGDAVRFRWARVDGDAVERRAARLGLLCGARWTVGGRTFLRLVRPRSLA